MGNIDPILLLRALQVALVAMGAIQGLIAWNEITNGENHSTNGANKKLIGGIAFCFVAAAVMQGVISAIENLGVL